MRGAGPGSGLGHALAVAAGRVPPETAQQAVGYPALFVLVALGALVPVVPTGALVSSAAVVAFHQRSLPLPLGVVAVCAVAAAAAFAGDLALYWLGQRGVRSPGGSRRLERLRARAAPERLAQARAQLDEHGVLVLVLSRLVPAGRIPVMLACLLGQVPLHRFARGDAPACAAWAATYGLIGILGGSLFSEPWKGVVAAVAVTLLISAGPAVWRRLRPRLRRRPAG
ncbi:VTT domain-containing protein [Streptomyces sp. NPDC046866]|uniref:VTT domain-containing protein n=1 Tax=Streptomyces sp. NPDC046866 TaxID=3154921 RepID=UPI003452688A